MGTPARVMKDLLCTADSIGEQPGSSRMMLPTGDSWRILEGKHPNSWELWIYMDLHPQSYAISLHFCIFLSVSICIDP